MDAFWAPLQNFFSWVSGFAFEFLYRSLTEWLSEVLGWPIVTGE